MKGFTFRRYAVLLAFVLPIHSVHGDAAKMQPHLSRAEVHEKNGEWDKACEIYEHLLRAHRSKELKDRYRLAVSRVAQMRRHRDVSYQKEVLSLQLPQAIELYGIVRDTILEHGLDRKKTSAADLFRKGIDELEAALADPAFLQQHVSAMRLPEVEAFRLYVRQMRDGAHRLSLPALQKRVRELALAGHELLGMRPTVVVMELTCGACSALDEYTAYLTPNQIRDLCESLKGRTLGVGLTLTQRGGKIVVVDVQPLSPAADMKIDINDHIVSIDKKATMQMSLEAAQEMLDGPADSTVELEIASVTGLRVLALTRRPIYQPSVGYQLKASGIGMIQIAAFQESTPQEVDEAMLKLMQLDDIRGLILDLRGNPGGSFEAAIDVARRFLISGVITSTQFSDPKFNATYQARNPNAWTMPMIVLIDSDTSSSAEILAGALKENDRAKLIGLSTFGKGCTQCVVKLHPIQGVPTGGVRLTIARFYSPKGRSYSGQGIAPDQFIEDAMAQMTFAVEDLQRQLGVMPIRP